MTRLIGQLVRTQPHRLRAGRQTFARAPAQQLTPEPVVIGIAHPITEAPRLIESQHHHFPEIHLRRHHQGVFRLQGLPPLQFRRGISIAPAAIRHGQFHALPIHPHRLSPGEDLRAFLHPVVGMTPAQHRHLLPDPRILHAAERLREHRTLPPLRRQRQLVSRLRRSAKRSRGRLELHRNQFPRRLVGKGVRQIILPRHHDQHRPAVPHTVPDDFPRLLTHSIRRHVAQNDDIKLPPFLRCGREAGGFGLPERPPGRRCNVRQGIGSRQLVGMQQHILELDRLVPAIKEIPQIPVFPAGVVIDQQHVGPVIAHRRIKRPFVILGKLFSLHRFDPDLPGKNPLLRRSIIQPDAGAPGIIRHLQGFFAHRLPVPQQLHLHVLATHPVQLQIHLHPQPVPEENTLRMAHLHDRRIPHSGGTSHHHRTQRRTLQSQLPRGIVRRTQPIVPRIGQQHHPGEAFRRVGFLQFRQDSRQIRPGTHRGVGDSLLRQAVRLHRRFAELHEPDRILFAQLLQQRRLAVRFPIHRLHREIPPGEGCRLRDFGPDLCRDGFIKPGIHRLRERTHSSDGFPCQFSSLPQGGPQFPAFPAFHPFPRLTQGVLELVHRIPPCLPQYFLQVLRQFPHVFRSFIQGPAGCRVPRLCFRQQCRQITRPLRDQLLRRRLIHPIRRTHPVAGRFEARPQLRRGFHQSSQGRPAFQPAQSQIGRQGQTLSDRHVGIGLLHRLRFIQYHHHIAVHLPRLLAGKYRLHQNRQDRQHREEPQPRQPLPYPHRHDPFLQLVERQHDLNRQRPDHAIQSQRPGRFQHEVARHRLPQRP